jgi:hypothetical protein
MAIAVSFVTMRKKKAQREHHYIRVVITYTDGETSGNRVFKDKTKAEEFAARQKASPAVKKVTLKRFVRDTYAATRVRKEPKPRSG